MLKDMKLKNRIIALMAINCLLFIVLFAIFSFTTGIDAIGNIALGGLVAVIILTIITTLLVIKPLDAPLSRMNNILKKVVDGDIKARIGFDRQDELGNISKSIDAILDDRMKSMTVVEDENETLNNSILALLETVAKLAQKDLTVKAIVHEDMTGPIADALNIMSSETSNVLNKVLNDSKEIAKTSDLVKSQADNVILLAENERNLVEVTVAELKSVSDTMVNINKLAELSNAAAEDASKSTKTAMSTVTNTVISINKIKDTIRETEKRIKRLGERSQEINSAVNLINNISERTHILALNASMHAAAAGEAGRGFAVVADEVQRLAESSREATSEIETLVNNIQLETSSTVNTMNELTSQVVEGSKLAEQAGNEMDETQTTTGYLVDMVQKIAQGASMQNKRTAKLRERADIIRKSVHKTGDHLQEQTVHTTKLVQQALELMEAVSVFTLKNNEKDVVASDIEESVPDSNIETDNIIKTDIDTNNDIISDSGIDMDTSDITVNLDIKLDE
ncbi:MAG: methyl-accepting chemotaxis protein [Proteobacteria bacterium]|nr:methyl-accepting chemotaxis protein [Pseudomonadota bacterium]